MQAAMFDPLDPWYWVLLKDKEIWETAYIEARENDYWLWLIREQLDEIEARPDHVAAEMADIFFIVLHWFRSRYSTEETPLALLERLTSRHQGHIHAILSEYGARWEKHLAGGLDREHNEA